MNDWEKCRVKNINIWIHPLCRKQTYSNQLGTVVLLGDAFFSEGDQSLEGCVKSFLNSHDWDIFDKLSGRFALVLLSKSMDCVVQDPFGSRTLYYSSSSETCIGSHSTLVAIATGQVVDGKIKDFRDSDEYRKRGNGYLPGDLTMYSEIRSVIPNNYFDLKSHKLVRFWPRREIREVSYEEFLDSASDYFKKLSLFTKNRYLPVLGLTGGVDSRALVAGLLGNGVEIELVTWAGNRLSEKERKIVEGMSQHLSEPHRFIEPKNFGSFENSDAYLNSTQIASGYCRGVSRLSLAMRDFSTPNHAFFRGYGAEIIRGFFNRSMYERGDSLKIDNPLDEFTRLYLGKRLKEDKGTFRSFSESAIESFMENANYNDNLYNVDLRDLYYWEQRMGTWGANKLNEMDPVIYGFVGFNSRKLFEIAFGLTDSERLNSKIMRDITSMYDPTFANIGSVS